VLVLLHNKDDKSRQQQPHQIQLRMPNGNTVKEYGPEISFMFSKPYGPNLDRGAALFGLVGGIVAVSLIASESKTQEARAEDFARKALKRGVINPGETRQGFVFFVLPDKTPPFADAALLLSLTDTSGDETVDMEIPIKVAPSPSFSARNR